MSRLSRVAFAAVLGAALSLSAWSGAFASTSTPLVRLDPARLFNPAAESLFAAVDPAMRLSSIGDDVFYVAASAVPSLSNDAPDVLAALPSHPVPSAIAMVRPATFNVAARYVPRLPGSAVATVETAAPASRITVPDDSRLASGTGSLAPPALQAPGGMQVQTSAVRIAPPQFGSYENYVPAMQSVSANVTVPVRVGGVHFSGVVEGSQAQTQRPDVFRALQLCGTTDAAAPCPYLNDTRSQSLTAGTDFDIRTGNGHVSVQLSGSVQRMNNESAAMFPYVPVDPDPVLDVPHLSLSDPQSGMLQYPGLADVVKHGLDARLAVPVNDRLTVGLQYDRQHYQGDYANGLMQGLDARKDTYLGNVTYQLPHTSSAITFSARQYIYQDSFAQNYNLTQTRADLNFTVKF